MGTEDMTGLRLESNCLQWLWEWIMASKYRHEAA